jgi:subtilisin
MASKWDSTHQPNPKPYKEMNMNKFLKITSLCIIFALVFSFMPGSSFASQGKKDYIVVYKAHTDPDLASAELVAEYSAEVVSIYRHALRAALVRASEHQIEQIAHDENVSFVEENQEWSIDAQTNATGVERVFATTNENIDIDGTNDFTIDADVAVLDTGIDLDHPDLNVIMAINCTLSGPFEGTCSGTKDDGNGHGTHVAGIIGAIDNNIGVVGVAPGVRLWAVKVLTNYGTGTTAQIIAGIDYVAAHADAIEVANMSLGGTGESLVMDLAISNAVAQGVTFVLSAGNRAINVDNYHPAGNPDAITVSALTDFDGLPGGLADPTCLIDIDDTLADFSNFGAGVDITAPGVCIYSTFMDGGYTTKSGTSMAAPYVSGAAALLASTNLYTPAEIKYLLTSNGNYDWVDDAPDGIQEPLLDISNMSVFAPTMLPTVLPITLSGSGYLVSAYQYTGLTWSGATTATVDIYRDGSLIVNTENDGFYTDSIGIKGRGTHTYRLCDASSTEHCSETITITY